MTDPLDWQPEESRWPIRSFLYIPAIRPEWMINAINAEVGAVIIDLEDAVGPRNKVRARALVPQEIETLRSHGLSAFLRPNGMSAGGADDLLACVRPGLTGIILPKASVDDICQTHDVLSYAEGKAGLRHGEVDIIALPETAKDIRDGYEIVRASPRVRGLLGGIGVLEGDVAWSCGFRPTLEGHEQLYLQSKIVIDSRAAGAAYPIAAIFSPRLDDLATLKTLVLRAKQLGFTGAAVIHPSHVKVVNSVFRPTEQEVAYYKGLIAALEQAGGAVQYDGKMVDTAMLPIARAVLAEALRHEPRSK